MEKPYDLSKPLVAFDHNAMLTAVIELSGKSWLVAAALPGIERRPLQKLPVDENRLLKQLDRWREEARKIGRTVQRRRRIRGGSRRLLAGPLATWARRRSLCDSSDACQSRARGGEPKLIGLTLRC